MRTREQVSDKKSEQFRKYLTGQVAELSTTRIPQLINSLA